MSMQQEVIDISKDLEEVYKEMGASALYIYKYNNINTNIDSVYGELINEGESYIPHLVIGKVSMQTEKENNLEVGRELDNYNYSVKLLKSSLEVHEIYEVNPKDKIMYNDIMLEISSVCPSIVLGDYFVQYDIQAYGQAPNLS